MALAAPLALVSAPSTRAFVDFDERVVSAHAGVTIVRAPVEVHGPIVAHASRRLRTSGFHPIAAFARTGAPLFREVAAHLGLGAVPVDPAACAEAIANAAVAQRAAIVAPLPAEGTWDRAVAAELARAPRVVLVLVTSDGTTFADTTAIDVASDLTTAEKLRWLSAVAEEAQNELPATDLRTLEAWWTKARRVEPDAAPAFDGLGEDARAILSCVALAGRSLSVLALSTVLGRDVGAALAGLADAGLVSCTGGLVAAAPAVELSVFEQSATREHRLAVAACLSNEMGGFQPDPWAFARAAELLVAAGAFDAADVAVAKAMKVGAYSEIACEIGTRWFEAVRQIGGADGVTLRVKTAERLLLLGDAANAQRWCESAAAIDPNNALVGLLMSRALVQHGDLVAARVCLTKAESHASADDRDLLARIAVEHAELHYVRAELDQTAAMAARAEQLATTVGTRLAARGTLGKLLLARGAWDQADEHFAQDAFTANAAGETTAELRARLNRAIAVLSNGRLDEARIMLQDVLADATRAGEDRARAYALANLGVVAYRQHDYATALSAWEQTIRFPQALRGRLSTAHTIGNLAHLRVRLGLIEHAEHAIAFGRRLLSGATLPKSSALYKWVAAHIALTRGNTELARSEVESSLADAQASGDSDCLESAWLVAVRVALEDGDLGRAAQAIAHTEAVVKSPRGRAELAIVRAIHLRALGQPALDSTNEALQLARAAGDEDLLSEVHGLLAMLYRDAGDIVAAQAHCSRAIAVRDQVAAGLPADIRAAFLAKAEIVALSRLQASLAHDAEEEAPRTQRIFTPAPASTSREMVGDDPAIRSLALAIKKVAKSNSTVLIRGESGTGKELVADALHRASDRASGPLVSVNCAALVETLLLSELFGHEKGAFTGASARRRGRFEMAEGGTLFLDEIGDISPRTQVALLRVLQEKTFERVGGTAPIRANVRVICATHRDLRAMVERGEFREDLYYRLRGITLEVPALRARLGDLPKIADHLLRRIADERNEPSKSLSSDALELFSRHRWPGNIRELENVLRAVSLFAEGDVITATDVIENVDDLRVVAQAGPTSQGPVSLRASVPPPAPSSVREQPSCEADDEEGDGVLPDGEANATAVAYAQVRQGAVSLSDIKRQIERDCIARALTETKGNITRAAALLGMKRPRLSQLVKQYGLSVASSEGNS